MTIRVFPPDATPPPPRRPYHDGYFAMYSSALGGIVTDPTAMTVPADDHVVHRGDGVFETLKCVGGRIYCLDAHLDRLRASAARIGLAAPESGPDLRTAVIETLRAGGRRDCLARVLLSRGPGGFGIAPAECPEPGLYVIAYRLPPSFMTVHPEGASAAIVDVPIKPGFLATIKTCNYLPNALMKAAAHAAGADFPIGFDERGFLAEGATENLGVVARGGALRLPRPERILDGITVRRVRALAPAAIRDGALAGVETGDIAREELFDAAEALVFGTTPDVTSVVRIDGRPIGDGCPGPVRAALSRLLEADIRANPDLGVPVFPDPPAAEG